MKHLPCICGSGADEEITRLRNLGQDVRVDNFAAPPLRKKIQELEAVLRRVRQWGADARSSDSYELFRDVKEVLVGTLNSSSRS